MSTLTNREHRTPLSGNGKDESNVFYNSSFQRECRALRRDCERVLEQLYLDTRSLQIEELGRKLEDIREKLGQEIGGIKRGSIKST